MLSCRKIPVSICLWLCFHIAVQIIYDTFPGVFIAGGFSVLQGCLQPVEESQINEHFLVLITKCIFVKKQPSCLLCLPIYTSLISYDDTALIIFVWTLYIIFIFQRCKESSSSHCLKTIDPLSFFHKQGFLFSEILHISYTCF